MRISDWSSDVCSSDLAKTDADITHNVLTQIIMEEEARGTSMLPVNFLRQLIAMYGDSMQAMVPGYLDTSMDSFRRNQEQFKSAVEARQAIMAVGASLFAIAIGRASCRERVCQYV